MPQRPPPAQLDPAATLPGLLQRARAAREASSLAEGRKLAEQAWALAQRSGTDDDRAEAGTLLCLLLYRQGELAALLDAGDAVLAALSAPERRSAKIDLLR